MTGEGAGGGRLRTALVPVPRLPRRGEVVLGRFAGARVGVAIKSPIAVEDHLCVRPMAGSHSRSTGGIIMSVRKMPRLLTD